MKENSLTRHSLPHSLHPSDTYLRMRDESTDHPLAQADLPTLILPECQLDCQKLKGELNPLVTPHHINVHFRSFDKSNYQ